MNGVNPFDWSGPWFLLAYLIFGVLVYYLARELLIRQELRNPHAQLSLADDPYRIAFLRGGALEAVKIAAIVLVDRGLLRRTAAQLRLRIPAALGVIALELRETLARAGQHHGRWPLRHHRACRQHKGRQHAPAHCACFPVHVAPRFQRTLPGATARHGSVQLAT